MISGIQGKIISIEDSKIEVQCGFMTFEIFVTAAFYQRHAICGEEIHLHTHLNVKEDELSLYGFETKEELKLFRQLIQVSGIGPKGALSILSYLTPEKLITAIISKDAKTIAKAQGIGPKTAEKLCIELKDRVSGIFIMPEDTAGEVSVPSKLNGKREETVMALVALGYSQSEAFMAVSKIPEDADESKLLNLALRNIGM